MTEWDHLIWSNYNLNYEDWRDELEEEYPDLPEQDLVQIMYERNADYLTDERMNLNIQLSQPILIIGDLGFWNGRCSGYKEIASGNISDCLYADTDFAIWYVDKTGDLRCDAIHHDSTNHYLYRAYKPGTTESQRDHLKEKIYNGTASRSDITRVTQRLGDAIGKIYGWDFPQHSVQRGETR